MQKSFDRAREQLSDPQYSGATIAAAIPGVGLSGRMGRVFSRIPTHRLTSRLARGYSHSSGLSVRELGQYGARAHSPAEVMQHFRSAKHTDVSAKILDGIERGRIRLRFREFPPSTIGVTYRGNIVAKRWVHFNEKVGSLLHEGQRVLDIQGGLWNITKKKRATDFRRAFPEMGAHKEATIFARQNRLEYSMHWRLRDMSDGQLLLDIQSRYELGMTDIQFH